MGQRGAAPRAAARGMKFENYPSLTGRRRLKILALAVATAVAVTLMMLDPPGGVQRTRPVAADAPLCSSTQTRGCVGGQVDVIAPAAAAASRR